MTTRTNTRLQGRSYERNRRLRGRTEGYEEERKATRKNRRLPLRKNRGNEDEQKATRTNKRQGERTEDKEEERRAEEEEEGYEEKEKATSENRRLRG